MLYITYIENPIIDSSAEELFNENPIITMRVKAPMFWWANCDFDRYDMCMPVSDFEYCLDAWGEGTPYIREMQFAIKETKASKRKLLQILPVSTYLEATIRMEYQQIVEVCENYCCGDYDYNGLYNQWPMSREWADFCETLLDIRGVRELLEKEGIYNG